MLNQKKKRTLKDSKVTSFKKSGIQGLKVLISNSKSIKPKKDLFNKFYP